jgi:hypothetical protein
MQKSEAIMSDELRPADGPLPGAHSEGTYFVAINGEAFGPYTKTELLQYVREQKILRCDPAWTEGLKEWVTVQDLIVLPEASRAETTRIPIGQVANMLSGVVKKGSRLARLTAETIRRKTKAGATPLHRAASKGTFDEIPRVLLAMIEQILSRAPRKAQLDKISRLGLCEKIPENASSQDAHDLLDSVLDEPPTDAQIKMAKESGFTLRNIQGLTARELDDLLKLGFREADAADLQTLRNYGIKFHSGNGLAARVAVALISQYEDGNDGGEVSKYQIAKACVGAMNDPCYATPTLSWDDVGELRISWPKAKLKDWLR